MIFQVKKNLFPHDNTFPVMCFYYVQYSYKNTTTQERYLDYKLPTVVHVRDTVFTFRTCCHVTLNLSWLKPRGGLHQNTRPCHENGPHCVPSTYNVKRKRIQLGVDSNTLHVMCLCFCLVHGTSKNDTCGKVLYITRFLNVMKFSYY